MREVRRGDDDGINSRLCDRFAVVGEDRAHAGLGAGAFDGGAVVSHSATTFAADASARPGRWFARAIFPAPIIATPTLEGMIRPI